MHQINEDKDAFQIERSQILTLVIGHKLVEEIFLSKAFATAFTSRLCLDQRPDTNWDGDGTIRFAVQP